MTLDKVRIAWSNSMCAYLEGVSKGRESGGRQGSREADVPNPTSRPRGLALSPILRRQNAGTSLTNVSQYGISNYLDLKILFLGNRMRHAWSLHRLQVPLSLPGVDQDLDRDNIEAIS
jgi:hypothetical protein